MKAAIRSLPHPQRTSVSTASIRVVPSRGIEPQRRLQCLERLVAPAEQAQKAGPMTVQHPVGPAPQRSLEDPEAAFGAPQHEPHPGPRQRKRIPQARTRDGGHDADAGLPARPRPGTLASFLERRST